MKSLVVGLGILAAVLGLPKQAHAAGVPLIYNHGDHTFTTGPLPAPFDKDPELAGYEAGYLCQVKGVFWSYFSVSDCKPVAFKDNTYADGGELTQALTAKYKESDMQRGPWGKFGWMGMAGIIALGGVLILKEQFGSPKKSPDVAE